MLTRQECLVALESFIREPNDLFLSKRYFLHEVAERILATVDREETARRILGTNTRLYEQFKVERGTDGDRNPFARA